MAHQQSPPTPELDAVIIGAGAAGLRAAYTLDQAGVRFIVLEGRDRIGGRILTYRDSRSPVPIELGAEFLHGDTEETDEILEQAGAISYEATGRRWNASKGKLTRIKDFWARMNRVMRYLDPERYPDRSFAEYLDAHLKGSQHAPDKRLAWEFVEGFHAADATRISERALAEGGNPGEDEEEARLARVLDGYDRVTEWLAQQVTDRIAFGTVVTRVEWSAGDVTVDFKRDDTPSNRDNRSVSLEGSSLRARSVIITVPLGVLKAARGAKGAIDFVPEVPTISKSTALLEMGDVTRVTLLFAERFWEKLRKGSADPLGLKQATFFHGKGTHFPVWWTLYPLRVPVMVGWSGGPRAAEMSGRSKEDLTSTALTALATHLGVKRSKLDSVLVDSFSHDWTADPFSRGAYSYALIGGSGANARLARPLEHTLYFAGEAADREGRTGTVEGALGTGRRVALEVIKGLHR
jgi:monoamine oxidase